MRLHIVHSSAGIPPCWFLPPEHRFVGSNQFCFKACYNTITSPDYCQNTYDLIGCSYNMPSAVQDGQFTSCDGDLQDVVGVYTVNGQSAFWLSFLAPTVPNKYPPLLALTWSMPDPLNTPPPYQPRVPASSNCQTYHSTDVLLAASSTVRPFLVSLLSAITDSTLFFPFGSPHLSFLRQVPLRNLVLRQLPPSLRPAVRFRELGRWVCSSSLGWLAWWFCLAWEWFCEPSY